MPEIKSTTLANIKEQADLFFKDKTHTKNQYDNYVMTLLCDKVVELEKERDQWKEKAHKLQSTQRD